jgi:hypothetical protein
MDEPWWRVLCADQTIRCGRPFPQVETSLALPGAAICFGNHGPITWIETPIVTT